MKKFALITAVTLGLASIAYAWMVPTWGKPLANETALAYNQTYSFQTNNSHVDTLSFQCVATSATVPTTTFNDSQINLNSSVISATNTFTSNDATKTGMIGLEVLYTSSTITVSPLVNQTTYYVIPISVNSFALATTSTGAIAGAGIVITSSGTAHTYQLKPLTIAGTPSYKWQVSNNGTNYSDMTTSQYNVAIPSVTLSTYVSTGTVNSWDFGPFDYTWIRLSVTAPTAGGIALQCTPNGEGLTGN